MYAVCAQLYPTLQPCSPPGSSVHRIFQQEYWSGLPFPTPGDLPDPGIEPMSPMSPTLGGIFFTTQATWEPYHSRKTVTVCSRDKRLLFRDSPPWPRVRLDSSQFESFPGIFLSVATDLFHFS